MLFHNSNKNDDDDGFHLSKMLKMVDEHDQKWVCLEK